MGWQGLGMKPCIEGITSNLKVREDNKTIKKESNIKTILTTTAGISAIFVLIAGGSYLPTYIFSLSEEHQKKIRQEVVVPTQQNIQQVFNDSIFIEDWKEEGEQQGLFNDTLTQDTENLYDYDINNELMEEGYQQGLSHDQIKQYIDNNN